MGNDPRLWKLHREEVGREIRSRRRPRRSAGKDEGAGLPAVFWRELKADAARLAGALGLTVRARKRKGVK